MPYGLSFNKSLHLPIWEDSSTSSQMACSGQVARVVGQKDVCFLCGEAPSASLHLSCCQECWTTSPLEQSISSMMVKNPLPYQCQVSRVGSLKLPLRFGAASAVAIRQAETSRSPNMPLKIFAATNSKRGRPRADVISTLQYVGSNSSCSIRCHTCHRVFPREKSLQAHLRTHTGERPYKCDFPNCRRSFVQSGQLKTHQRLHSGEKPFKCSEEGCNVRFTHANRHCSQHVNAKLVRDDNGAFQHIMLRSDERDEAVHDWLSRHIHTRLERGISSGHVSGKQDYSEDCSSSEEVRTHDSDYRVCVNVKPSVKRCLLDFQRTDSGRKDLADEVSVKISNCEDSMWKVLSPKDENRPRNCQPMKKRILAYSERLLKAEDEENVPLGKKNVVTDSRILPTKQIHSLHDRVVPVPEPACPPTPHNVNCSLVKDLKAVNAARTSCVDPSIGRPSVLVFSKFTAKHFPSDEATEEKSRWNSALALMELASSPPGKNARRNIFQTGV